MIELLRTVNRAVEILRLLAGDLERPSEPATKRHDRHVARTLRAVAGDLQTQLDENAPPHTLPALPPTP